MKYLNHHFKYVGYVAFAYFLCSPAMANFIEKSSEDAVGSPDVTASLLKVTGGLLLVLLAIFGSAWVYKRFGNITPIATDDLRIIGGVSMGQKERVVLMQVGEEQILLGVSPGRIERLHVLKKNIEMKESEIRKDNSFSSQFKSALKATALKQKKNG